MMTPTSYLAGTALMLGGIVVDAFALCRGEDETLSALLWRAGGLLLLAGLLALCLSGCGGCYEPTPDGLGITACKGKSW